MITYGFLFWLFLIGIIVASLQDLKRKEVDDWLNLFLIVASFSFILLMAFFEKDATLVFQLGFLTIILFILMNAFYYGYIFAGGDAKLLFAMTAFFIGLSFFETLINLGIFILFLMFSGALYGIGYSLALYFKNFKKVNEGIKQEFGGIWIFSLAISGFVLIAVSLINFYFFFLTLFIFVFPLIYVFAKGLEDVSMIKTISWKDLREGDWLAQDVVVGNKIIKAKWDGVSNEEIELMKNLKSIKIKDGMPFVPAFFIAFISYVFFKNWVLDFLLGAV